MKFFSNALLSIAVLPLIASCDRNDVPTPEEPAKEMPTIEETKPAAQKEPAQSPALTEAAVESLIFDALSPTGEEVAAAGDTKFSINDLPEAQRKTLNEAVTKAVSKIDFKALLTSITSNLEVNGLDLKGLPGNMKVSTRVLTPEEAKKMGINIQGLEGVDSPEGGSGKISVGSMQVITIGSPGSKLLQRGESGEGDPTSTASEPDNRIQEIFATNVTEDNDPERADRLRSLLESGDSDALAGEIANLIQTAIDSATLQQAMEGGASSTPKK